MVCSFLKVTVATKCIKKGDEITHTYQCHFATTPKFQRQTTLQKIFHFLCRCSACENDFPLARDIPKTYMDTASFFSGKTTELEKFFLELKNISKSMDCTNILGKNERIMKMFKKEIRNIDKSKNLKTLKKILSLLDEYNKLINESIKASIASKKIENCLTLYYEKQKLASMFLKSPHAIFISAKEAIIDCLLIKHANISSGMPRNELIGKYHAYYYRNLL